jgi:hypothetical protein
MSHVLHLVAARFKPDADAPGREHAVALAYALRDADGVEAVIVAASEQRIIVATWLTGRAALEPFAASPMHMRFVMRGLAPVISGMWSASVETSAGPPAAPAALWVFALGTTDVFEWQVRDLLQSVDALPGHPATGPTVEERDRYRAGGAVALAFDEVGPFEGTLRERRAEWSGLAEAIEEASAPVAVQP